MKGRRNFIKNTLAVALMTPEDQKVRKLRKL